MGYVPYQLKYAEIKPVFKKGCKQDPDNYRPVSILPSFSKIIEKIVSNQLIEHFERNCLLIAEQYGFRAGRNTTKAVIDFVQKVADGLDDSKSIAGVFCECFVKGF